MSGSQVYWHVYSPKLNGGLCRVCLLFDTSDDTYKHGAFVKSPFQKLEQAFSSCKKNQGIINSQLSKSSNNIYALQRLKISYTIVSIHRLKYKAELTKLFKKIKCILCSVSDAILLCDKQGISLRGHRNDSADPSTNRGNFLAILEAFAN